MKRITTWVAGAMAVTLGWGALLAGAQTRPTDARSGEDQIVVIKDLEGIGPRARVKTPIYTSSASAGRVPAREWGRVQVVYDTAPEWIDELAFQFFVLLLKDEKGRRDFTLLKGAVSYQDVARGRKHESMMFVRPTTLLRYGEVIGAAVEVLHNGEVVGVRSVETSLIAQQPEWWKNPKLTAREGMLLNRSQTPFALVNYDDYDPIK